MPVDYPAFETLTNELWEFSHLGGPLAAPALRLIPDGAIEGYRHANEASWRLDGDILAFVGLNGEISTRFDVVHKLDDERIVLSGRFLLPADTEITLRLEQKARRLPITREIVVGSTWLLSANAGAAYPGEVRCRDDGTLVGSKNGHLQFWEIVDGKLFFLAAGRVPSACFDDYMQGPSGARMNGPFLLDPSNTSFFELKEYRRLEEFEVLGEFTTERPSGGSRATLAQWISSHGWSIGEYTYGTPIVFEPTLAKLNIGRFTSIAAYVSVALGNHSMFTATTYPFSSMPSIWAAAPPFADHETKGDVNIGNDVWIGAFVFISSGVTIGHGAIIGAHTTVTKDVPPYAIIAGNPGRILRYRFSPDVVQELLDIAWWDWPDRRLAAALPFLMSRDIQDFITYCKTSGK